MPEYSKYFKRENRYMNHGIMMTEGSSLKQ